MYISVYIKIPTGGFIILRILIFDAVDVKICILKYKNKSVHQLIFRTRKGGGLRYQIKAVRLENICTFNNNTCCKVCELSIDLTSHVFIFVTI